jgi:trimeric autotransporter adhesin
MRSLVIAAITAVLAVVALLGVLANVFAGNSNERTSQSGPTSGPAEVILTAIAIAPAESTIGPEEQQQLTATATFSDGSTQNMTTLVDWESGNLEVANVDDRGLVTAAGVGTTTVTGTLDGQQGTATITVATREPDLTAIEIILAPPRLCAGEPHEIRVDGTYSDESTQDITELVSLTFDGDAIVSRVDDRTITGTGGETTITASLNDLEDTTTVSFYECPSPRPPEPTVE